MEVFGVGPAELVLILIVVLIVFGPEQLPEIAKKIGSATRDLRHGLDDISSEMNENLQPFKDLGDATKLLSAESQVTAPEPPAEDKTNGPDTMTPALTPEQPADSSQS